MRIEIPAEAIKATTAGRREFKIPCKSARFLYFKYSLAIQVTMMQDGRMHPKVAERAPPVPAIFVPTKVAGSFPLQTGMYQMVKDSNQKILLQSAEPQIK